MGVCHSSCTNTSSLEFYDAWGHQPIRRPYKANGYNKDDTKLWMCKRGCCSVRWKLDYAEFQSFFKYVEVSPYVILQDKTRQCDCVLCRGMSNASPPERRWNGPLLLKKGGNRNCHNLLRSTLKQYMEMSDCARYFATDLVEKASKYIPTPLTWLAFHTRTTHI